MDYFLGVVDYFWVASRRVLTVLRDAANSAGPTPRVQWEHCTLLTAHGAQASLPHMMHLR